MPDDPTAPPADAGRKLVRFVFPRGATAEEIADGIRRLAEEHKAQQQPPASEPAPEETP